MANAFLRSAGLWFPIGAVSVVPDPEPDPDPDPVEVNTSWEEAWVTDDQTTIDAWYESNTGFEGYVAPELGRRLVLSDLTQQSGSFNSTADGQTFYKMDFRNIGKINVTHNDVTFRGCRFDFSTTSAAMFDQPSGQRLKLEYCTFYGTSTTQANARVAYFRGNSEATVRFCKVPNDSLVGSAFLRIEEMMGVGAGIVAEYNYIRWLGSHEGRCTAIALRCDNVGVRNVTLRRNNIRGRASACITMYNRGTTETNPNAHMENVLWEENLFNTLDRDLRTGQPYALYSWPQNWFNGSGYTVYATRFGQGTENGLPTAQHVNVRVLNNRFGRWSYPSCGGGKPAISSGFNLASNQWSGNRMLGGDKAAIDPSGDYDFGTRASWSFVGDQETTGHWEKI